MAGAVFLLTSCELRGETACGQMCKEAAEGRAEVLPNTRAAEAPCHGVDGQVGQRPLMLWGGGPGSPRRS